MRAAAWIAGKTRLAVTALACCAGLCACSFEAPVTATPTRTVDARLLGEWTSKDEKGKAMTVGRLDASTYIVLIDGTFFRAYHSDLAQHAFISAEQLGEPQRKYAYMTWALSGDDTQLALRVVDGGNWLGQNGPIPPEVSKDSSRVQKFLLDNTQNSKLFVAETLQYTKAK